MIDGSICEFIQNIKKDPFKKLDNLQVGDFNRLSEHLKYCLECSRTVDEICEKYKDVPPDPNSEWERSKYN